MLIGATIVIGLLAGLAWLADKYENYTTCRCTKGWIDPWCPRHGWLETDKGGRSE